MYRDAVKYIITLTLLVKHGEMTWRALTEQQQRRMDSVVASLKQVGTAKARLQLGDLYEEGKGVPQDFAEAMVWYRKDADQGNAKAQWCVGCLHGNGQGVKQDYAEALRWYRLSADQGHTEAQF